MSVSCNVCSGVVNKVFDEIVIKKYRVAYFKCSQCGFVQTEKPFWLDEAYASSINLSDTGLVSRNIKMHKVVSLLLIFKYSLDGKFLDYGGGYGLFARLMRDYGFDFYTTDPNTPNLLARGFDYTGESEKREIEFVTCFECFEHFPNPKASLEKILKISDNILFSTEIIPDLTPQPSNWEYFGFNHGQHISFYSRKSIYCLAGQYGLNAYSFRNIHLLTKKPFGLWVLPFVFICGRLGMSSIFKPFIKSRTVSDSIILGGKIKK